MDQQKINSYSSGQLSDFLEKHIDFIDIVKNVYRYYSIIECKLSMLIGTRDYEKAEKIMRILLDVFMSNRSNTSIKMDLTALKTDIYTISSEIASDYFKKIIILKKEDISNYNQYTEEFEKYRMKDAATKIRQYADMIERIDETHPLPQFVNDSDTCQQINDIGDIAKTIDRMLYLCYLLYSLYIKIYKMDIQLKHVAEPSVFVSEFHMFLNHLTFAYLADNRKDNQHSYNNYILKNINRSIKHLERCSIDITKIIASSL